MSKISFEEIFARSQTKHFYKYKKNRETDDKIVIYELKSLVSIVNTNLLLWYCTILKINHFASARHKDILYRDNLKAKC